jgi:hypothetical protein
VLSDLADALERVLLEQLDGGSEQEAALGFAAGRGLRDGFDQPATGGGDLAQRPLESNSS